MPGPQPPPRDGEARTAESPDETGPLTLARYLFVVSQRHPELYELLLERFEGDRNVEVILDRRVANARSAGQHPPADRRRLRSRAYDLRMRSHLVITRD